ncbi:hypothetical protein [Metabacillus fastidiosus]|uniref:hypothetical protein n=1 Tax=Metabacillus fastidiosus TaxID=1458 RepID=UPI003D2D7116
MKKWLLAFGFSVFANVSLTLLFFLITYLSSNKTADYSFINPLFIVISVVFLTCMFWLVMFLIDKQMKL